MNQNVAQSNRYAATSLRVGTFDETIWMRLTESIGRAFGLTKDRIEGMKANPVLKMVGALPYFAGCDEPERTALAHMGTYMLASLEPTKDAFSHNFQDSADPARRLERISHFPGGDPAVIDRGMKLLTIAMLGDHLHDAELDAEVGKLNPVNAGHWDAEELIEELRDDLAESPCPEMDAVLGPSPTGFWIG